jgi:hypothetical protein
MNRSLIASARSCSLLLASSLAFVVSPSPAMLGGPACPSACPKVCSLQELSPSVVDNLCVDISMFWGRKQDGFASEPGCTQCRQCLAVAVYDVSADPGCMVPGEIKFQAGDGTPTVLPTNPDGSGSASGRSLVIANCDAFASYTVKAWLPTDPAPDQTTIYYSCEPCPAQ